MQESIATPALSCIACRIDSRPFSCCSDVTQANADHPKLITSGVKNRSLAEVFNSKRLSTSTSDKLDQHADKTLQRKQTKSGASLQTIRDMQHDDSVQQEESATLATESFRFKYGSGARQFGQFEGRRHFFELLFNASV